MAVWVVTGASKGLGAHLVKNLLANGNEVFGIARNRADFGNHYHHIQCDLSNSTDVLKVAQEVIKQSPIIYGVINCAGFGFYKKFSEHSPEEIINMVTVNLTSPMLLTQALLPAMLNQHAGHIINISSDVGHRPLANMVPYVASKYGMTGFTQSLLREYRDQGIKVTLVSPGIIDTNFNGGTEGTKEHTWSLDPEILAQTVMHLIEAPGSMVVDEIKVHPLMQDDF